MSPDSSLHDTQVRDEVGNEEIHSKAAKQKSGVNGIYKVIHFPGREFPQQYHALLFSKWMRSLRHQNDYYKLIDPKCYYEAYRKYIQVLLDRPETVVRLAVLEDDDDVVLGFSVVRETILDYVHVLRIRINTDTGFEMVDYRRKGIGSRLVPKDIDTFTHITKTAILIWSDHKYKHWKFNPFA